MVVSLVVFFFSLAVYCWFKHSLLLLETLNSVIITEQSTFHFVAATHYWVSNI